MKGDFQKSQAVAEVGKAASNFITAPREPDSPDACLDTMRLALQLEVGEVNWGDFRPDEISHP